MFELWKEPLTDEDRDRLLDKVASEVHRRKLEAPAVLFLEMHKPLSYVASHAALAFSPFLIPFLGFDNVNDYTRLLADRGNVERLLLRLEQRGDPPANNEEARCTS